MALIQLSYISTATTDLSDAELNQIVASAIHKNAANGITGMLLYADGRFMQLLEGEEAAVDATFARVRTDPRHRDVQVTERGPLEARSFADWSMGFKRMGDSDMRAITAGVSSTSDNAPVGGGLAAAILHELARDPH